MRFAIPSSAETDQVGDICGTHERGADALFAGIKSVIAEYHLRREQPWFRPAEIDELPLGTVGKHITRTGGKLMFLLETSQHFSFWNYKPEILRTG